MNRRRIALWLALVLVFSLNSNIFLSIAAEDVEEGDSAETVETDAENDAIESEPGSDMDEFHDDSIGESAEDEVSDASDIEEPDFQNEPDEDYLWGVFPVTLVEEEENDDDTIRITVPTFPAEEGERVVTEESEIEATGVSTVSDPAALNLRPDDVVSMVMPVITDDMYNFTLDPNDFLSRYSEDREYYDGSGLYFKNAGETVKYSGISDAAMGTNKSSVPVVMKASLELHNENGWDIKYTDLDDVVKGEDRNISFALVPVSGEGDEQVLHKDRQISIDKDGHAEVTLYLDAERDNFEEKDGKLVEKDSVSWNQTGFAVAGKLNTAGDWKEIVTKGTEGEKIYINIKCRMRPATQEEQEAIENGTAEYDKKTGIVKF